MSLVEAAAADVAVVEEPVAPVVVLVDVQLRHLLAREQRVKVLTVARAQKISLAVAAAAARAEQAQMPVQILVPRVDPDYKVQLTLFPLSTQMEELVETEKFRPSMAQRVQQIQGTVVAVPHVQALVADLAVPADQESLS